MVEVIKGGCHCGNISLQFRASKPFSELPVRACQCTFCRKRGFPDDYPLHQIRFDHSREQFRNSVGGAGADLKWCTWYH